MATSFYQIYFYNRRLFSFSAAFLTAYIAAFLAAANTLSFIRLRGRAFHFWWTFHLSPPSVISIFYFSSCADFKSFIFWFPPISNFIFEILLWRPPSLSASRMRGRKFWKFHGFGGHWFLNSAENKWRPLVFFQNYWRPLVNTVKKKR